MEIKCERCEKDCEELITREGFVMTYFVEWVCYECFRKLEGKKFEDYTAIDYYGQVSE